MKLIKYKGNPILKPNSGHKWESLAVCNPGAWQENGTTYLLYRAAGNDKEHKIHFGLATSKDGLHFTRMDAKPVLSPSKDGCDAGCIEDPRIVKMDDYYYVTYAFRPIPPGKYWEKDGFLPEMPYLSQHNFPKFIRNNLTMSGLLLSRDLRSFHRAGTMTAPDVDDRDVILFPEKVGGKYVMLHRPSSWVGPEYGCDRASIWIAFGNDPLIWKEHFLLARPQFQWEEKKIGGSTPPIKTQAGWLTIYHGVDSHNVYRAGVMMLDLSNPKRVIARAPDFILEPEHEYETKGIMKNVVFPTGNVVINGQLHVYYGGGDKTIAVAYAPLQDVIDYVMSHKVKS